MRYQITSKRTVPEAMANMGYTVSIVIEAGAVHLPLKEEIEAGGAVAHFNGFEIELMPGDVIEELEEPKPTIGYIEVYQEDEDDHSRFKCSYHATEEAARRDFESRTWVPRGLHNECWMVGHGPSFEKIREVRSVYSNNPLD